jgi:histidine ammonia-lyase
MLLALRINVLAKGYSGISLSTLKQLIEAFNGESKGFKTISGSK